MLDRLVIGTTNKGKLNEISELFKPLKLEISELSRFNLPPIMEDGDTFLANARKKAEMIAELTGYPTLADDSGLEVDYLNYEPGVKSARYAGENATDLENIQKLLTNLKDVPFKRRKARFVTILALAIPGEETVFSKGRIEGYITASLRGKNGFGYDPVFYLPQYGKTMAELPLHIKNQISHRGQALKIMLEIIKKKMGIYESLNN